MKRKLLFFDIDGTLVGYDSFMPKSATMALRMAQANGHKLLICTGRSKHQIYKHLLDFGFDGIVSATGGYVEYERKELYHSIFGKKRLKKVMDYFAGTQAGLLLQRKEDSISAPLYEKTFIEAFAKRFPRVQHLCEISPFANITLDDNIENYSEKYWDVESIIYCNAAESTEIIRRLAPEIHVETASYKEPEPYSGEITLSESNKATGIQKVLEHLGMKREDVIAFGDGANDMEMLDFAGTSVVMGNAPGYIKEHASYVTSDLNKDGIYHAMKHLQLI